MASQSTPLLFLNGLTTLERSSVALLAPFTASLLFITLKHHEIFTGRHGRLHRLLGAGQLLWLAIGVLDVVNGDFPTSGSVYGNDQKKRLAYDLILAILGCSLTISAASSFGSRRISNQNRASGALDKDATITRAEMTEHLYYQLLNGLQIVYFHALPWVGTNNLPARLGLLALVTLPWLLRPLFPVNSFSANWTSSPEPWNLVSTLYRIKKLQYVLYKAALLHGLNITAALYPTLSSQLPGPQPINQSLPQARVFRLYWICLNAAYVLEFFLQTLVKRKALEQGPMLFLNSILVLASMLAALPVILLVRPEAALLSLGMNWVNRKRDVVNVAGTTAGMLLSGRFETSST